MNPRIFIFEDNTDIRESLREICTIMGYETHAFSDPTEIVLKFGKSRLQKDLIVTDIKMPFITGIELTETLIRSGFDAENIAMMSGDWSDEYLAYARRLKIRTFSKPFSISELTVWLEKRGCQTDADCVSLDLF